MTDTPSTDASPTVEAIPDGLGLAFSLSEGPDGTVWPALQFRTMTMTVVIQIPPTQADILAETIAAEIKRAGREARRENKRAKTSLVVPDSATVSRLAHPSNNN